MILGALTRRFDYGYDGVLPFKELLTFRLGYATLGPVGVFGAYESTGVSQYDLRVYFGVTGIHNPFQRYYGVGDQTGFSQNLIQSGYYFYTFDYYSIESFMRKNWANDIEFKAGLTIAYRRLSSNSLNSQYAQDYGSAPDQGFYTKLQLGLLTDKRDFEFIPSNGYYASFLFNYSPSFLGTGSSWTKADLDIRYYWSLIPQRWLWIASQFLLSASSNETPIFEKVKLGSQGTLRGLPLNRYLSSFSSTQRVDLRSVLVRTKLWDKPFKAGLGSYFDLGQVGDIFPRLFQTGTHLAAGISLFASYFTDDFLVNADIGFSQDGTFIYTGLGYAF